MKSIFKSKTAAFNALVTIAAFVPQVQAFVVAYPQAAMLGLGLVGLGLRKITHGRVSIFPSE